MVERKVLFFDSGPVISLVVSRLSFILPELKKKYGGTFYITPAVHRELIERPLTLKRFEFEALQVMKLVKEGVLEVYEDVPQRKVKSLISLANSSFLADGKTMDIMQEGEMESIACALKVGAQALVMDERTLRLFIEDAKALEKLLSSRFEKQVTSQTEMIKAFNAEVTGMSIIRSVELVGVAYKLKLLGGYLPEGKGAEELLLDATLWATKYSGCAVTEDEIGQLKRMLLATSR